jgi:hypothetical protein
MKSQKSLGLAIAAGAVVVGLAVYAVESRSADEIAGPQFAQLQPTGPDMPSGANVPAAPAPADQGDNAGEQVLTRGPVHEAFAKPLELNPQPGPIVKKEPPQAIEEVPPDQKPEGDNVVWVSGYWAWDDDRNDFLWVSGVWRNVPPGQTWVAGYWSPAAGGYQWTPGFWAAAKNEQVAYVSEAPPESLENGPSSPQPGDNYFWIPGNYVYANRYAWQPGYWTVARPNWVWTPANWVWTPGGYIFIAGFWDYLPAHRGLLFAPVYFTPVVYTQPAFVYTPSVLINVGFFNSNLFCRPSYCHYYFGDYYAAQYASLGFRPWFDVRVGTRLGYDPLFVYFNWQNSRRDPRWLNREREHFASLQRNEAERPPHTFLAQQEWLKKNNDAARRPDLIAAQPLQQVAKNPSLAGVKLQPVSQQARQDMLSQAQILKKASQERVNIETKPLDKGSPAIAGGAKLPPTQTLKLPTITTTKTKVAENDQPGGAKLIPRGGQELTPGALGNPQGTPKLGGGDMPKTFTPGGVPSKDTGPKTGGDTPGKLVLPGRGTVDSGAGAGGTVNKTDNPGRSNVLPRGGSGQSLTIPQGGGQNLTIPPSGGGAGGPPKGSGTGAPTVTPRFTPPPSGGGGGGQPPKKDKDDDPKKGKSTDATSPRTNFSFDRGKPSGIDVPGLVESEQKAMRRDQEGPTKSAMEDAKNLTSGKPDSGLSNPAGGQSGPPAGPGVTGIPKSPTGDRGGNTAGRTIPGLNGSANPLTRLTDQQTATNQSQTSTDRNSEVPYSRPAASGLDLRPRTDTSNSGPSSSAAYRTMLQRGQSLSQGGTANAQSATGSTPGGAAPAADQRLKKDPVGSIGFGSSPLRYPGMGGSYSAQGPAVGQGNSGLNSATSPTGIPQFQRSGNLPRLQRSTTAPPQSSDPAARTYDPNQDQPNSYDPRVR